MGEREEPVEPDPKLTLELTLVVCLQLRLPVGQKRAVGIVDELQGQFRAVPYASWFTVHFSGSASMARSTSSGADLAAASSIARSLWPESFRYRSKIDDSHAVLAARSKRSRAPSRRNSRAWPSSCRSSCAGV